ncbi:MAG: UDP-glucose/GDP-mannose dehydrogenase family protein [Acidobacteriota bacterium]|nr:UDP-glucose/GDP-mannose dehydrogenase family protein [Acidobacteriota bacterium]
MNVCVVGSGYVGLVTGACLADFGMQVTCIDKDEAKIAALQRSEIPIYEPGLRSIVFENTQAGRLHFSTDLVPAIHAAQAIFIAVGTPSREDGSANLSFVRDVAQSIADHINGYKVIVTKSTVPIGTGRMIETIVRSGTGKKYDFSVVSNPEFLREGSAISDFLRPDRVVIGSTDERATGIMLDIYSPLQRARVPFVLTTVESAELIKYASNAFLATKISFINEVADLCERVGADVEVVARGMGLDKRVGAKFLHPGPGFGGSCFPKDSRAIVQIASDHDMTFQIMEAVLKVNEATKERMVDKVLAAFDGSIKGKTIGILGLSFKPETDDMRESPALKIVDGLLARGAHIRAYDPAAMNECRHIWSDVVFGSDAYDTAIGADGLVIITEWNEFRALELDRLAGILRTPLIVDLRNIYEPEKVRSAGFRYVSLGRKTALPHPEEVST